MAPLVDHVLALLPFEPPLMQAAGMRCDFVGHPVVAEPQADAKEAASFRHAHDIAADAPLLLALPGSRRGEITRLGPRFAATLERVLRHHPGTRIVVPAVADQAELLRAQLRDWPGAPILIDPARDGASAKRAAFAAADLALAASGTVSLELAASRTPMVIAYDVNPFTRAVLRQLLRIDTVTLVNLVSDSRTIPEFLGTACRPERIAPALARLIADPEARSVQHAAMAATLERLGQGGPPPGERAARAVLATLAGYAH